MKESFDTSDQKIKKYELGLLKNKQSISSQEFHYEFIGEKIYQESNLLS